MDDSVGTLRCFDGSLFGELGYGNTDAVGDGPNEMPLQPVSAF